VAREQVLVFRVGSALYGIGIGSMWEVLSPEGVSSLPTPPHQVCTALAYRGTRLPLVRLGVLFGTPGDRVLPSARVLLTQGARHLMGLLVDEVLEVAEIDPQRIMPMPALASVLGAGLFRGLVSCDGRVIIVIDEAGLSAMPEVARFVEG
jgi:purine-binding chemotaxis protein CheW